MEKFYQTLILHRIKKILKDEDLATYKLQKRDIVQRLNTYFWDKAEGLDGFWNKKIYKKYIQFIKEAKEQHKNRTNIDYRTTYADNLNTRTDELITHLINQDLLRADNDNPPSYYIVHMSVWRFFVLFKWIIIQVIFLGLLVAIIANLISNYIWQVWLQ
ncbi:MAG: hypothetical protein WD509_02540 [Candidatus Paceibacterota bacterium]